MKKYCCSKFAEATKNKIIYLENNVYNIEDGSGCMTILEDIKYCPFCGKELK